MARVKGGYVAKNRRRKVLKLAKGYFGSKRTLYKTAHEQVMKSLTYAYRDRKQRKRNFRKLWITRINAAARLNGMSYSRFMNGLKLAGVEVNRKMLAEIAVYDMDAFTNLVKLSQEGLASNVKPEKTETKVAPKETAKKAAPKKETAKKAAPKKETAKKAAPKKETAKKTEVKVKEETVKTEKKAPVQKEEVSTKENVDYSTKTVAELKAIAKEKNIKGYSKLKKAELIEALK
ncbi:50S ribosomal protein L20 [Mycoplasmatota bacterium]|nr:50S ribosomal protein L20 [Mycoplasmatota bacterium]